MLLSHIMNQPVVNSTQDRQTLIRRSLGESNNYCLSNPLFTNPLLTNPLFTNPLLTNPPLTSSVLHKSALRNNVEYSPELPKRQCSDIVDKTGQILVNGSRKTVSFDCPTMNADQWRRSLEVKTSKYSTDREKWIQPVRIRRRLPDLPNISMSLNEDVIGRSITNMLMNSHQQKEKRNVHYLKSDICSEGLWSAQGVLARQVSMVTHSDKTAVSTEADNSCRRAENEYVNVNDAEIGLRYNCGSGTIKSIVKERTFDEDICFSQNTPNNGQYCKTQLDQVMSGINYTEMNTDNYSKSLGVNCNEGLPSSAEHLRLKLDSMTDCENNELTGGGNKSVNGSENNSTTVRIHENNSVMASGSNSVITRGSNSVIASRNNAVNGSGNNSVNGGNNSMNAGGHSVVPRSKNNTGNGSGNNAETGSEYNVVIDSGSKSDNRPSLSLLLTYTHLLCVILNSPLNTGQITLELREVCINNHEGKYSNSTSVHEHIVLNQYEENTCSKYERKDCDKIDPTLTTFTRSNTSAFSLVRKSKSCLHASMELKSSVDSQMCRPFRLVAVLSVDDCFKIACGGQIQAGDYIIEINGYNVTASDVDDVTDRLTRPSAPISVVIGRPRLRYNMTSQPVPPSALHSTTRATTRRSSDEETHDRIERHFNKLLQQRDEELGEKDKVIKQLTEAVHAARGKCSNDVTIPSQYCVCCQSFDCREMKLFIEQDQKQDGCEFSVGVQNNDKESPSYGSNNEIVSPANEYEQNSIVSMTNERKYRTEFLSQYHNDGQVLCGERSDNQVLGLVETSRSRFQNKSISLSNGFEPREMCIENGLDHDRGERLLNELNCNDKYDPHGLSNTKECQSNRFIHRNNLQQYGQVQAVGCSIKVVESQLTPLTNIREESELLMKNDLVNVDCHLLQRKQSNPVYCPMSERLCPGYKDVDKRGWYESNCGSGEDCIETIYDPELGWQRISEV